MELILAFVVLTATLAAISVIDWRTRRIPDVLSLPLIAAGLLWGHRYGPYPLSDHLLGALIGYGALAAFGWLYFYTRGHEGLGLGDAKLFAAAGAWLAWPALPTVLLISSLGGLGYAIAMRIFRADRSNTSIAFGPWIAIATWLVWIARNRPEFI